MPTLNIIAYGIVWDRIEGLVILKIGVKPETEPRTLTPDKE